MTLLSKAPPSPLGRRELQPDYTNTMTLLLGAGWPSFLAVWYESWPASRGHFATASVLLNF